MQFMENFKAVIFDMDGTMFDTENLQVKMWIEIGQKYNFNITEELVKSTIGISREGTKQIYKKALGDEFDFDHYRNIREENVNSYIEENGVPQKEGLIPLLNYLRDNRYAIAIATSSRNEKTYKYLEKTGIKEYFHTVVTGEMIAQGKPNPDIFLKAYEMLNKKFDDLQRSECVVVEDAPGGIEAAKKAEMNVIMVPDLIEPTLEVEELLYAKCKSLKEVKQKLEEQKCIKREKEELKVIRRVKLK